jgi:hypothetical protein
VAIIAGTSHNLKNPANPNDPGFTSPVAPAALDRLEKWALANLQR